MRRALIGLAVALGACSATTRQAVVVNPGNLKVPTSLSGYYRDAAGTVVTPMQYKVVGNIRVERVVQAPIVATTVKTIDLAAALEPEVQRSNAEAVVNLTVRASQYSGGNTKSYQMRNALGTGWILGGLSLVAIGVAMWAGLDDAAPLYAAGIPGGVLAVTGLIVRSSATRDDSSQWDIVVEGDAVQRLR